MHIYIKNKKNIFGILIALTIFISCKKVLNPDIIELPTSANAFTSANDIEQGIAAAYSYLRAEVPDKVFLFSDVRSNSFASYSDNQNVAIETPIPRNVVTALLQNGGGNWGGFYKAVAQCNLVLEKIPTIATYDDEKKKRHIGEAHFLRALAYFYLVRFWGDVPINLKSANTDVIVRSPQGEVFKLINSDLDVAISNLKPAYGGGDLAVRATKGAAWAIKAHVMGWVHDYPSCEKLCDSVINSNQYALITDSSKLINIFIGKSAEGIFEFNFDASLKEVQQNRIYYRTMHRPYYDNGGIGDKVLMFPPYDQRAQLFPPGMRDKRLNVWFVSDKWGYTSLDYPFFGKYRTLQAGGDTASKNINESNCIVTRLADIILLRAEALSTPEVNRPTEAAALLNVIRWRASAQLYEPGTGSLADTILLERKKELLGEGQFFFDLVRTRKLDKYSRINESGWYEKGAWLLPIDQSILAKSNFTITQNNYWQ